MRTVAVYTITRDKLSLTKRSFAALRKWAGVEYDHFVFDNGSTDGTAEWLSQEYEAGRLFYVNTSSANLGQNNAANTMLEEIVSSGKYGWVLRWDPDAMPRTRRFLRKLVGAAERFREKGLNVVASPRITKLKHPPPPIALGHVGNDTIGEKFEVVAILGGICRLHPIELFDGFRFNHLGALGFGEALEMADLCKENNIPRVRINSIKVEHYKGEDGQALEFPAAFAFERKEMTKYVGYGLGY